MKLTPTQLILLCVFIYLLAINIIAVSTTVFDKKMAEKKKSRVPESTLLILAALSGCVAEYATMKYIRHKTRKKKFMIGIPIIFTIEVLIAVVIFILV